MKGKNYLKNQSKEKNMSIPSFNEEGFLPEGIHQCTGEEFLERFCQNDEIRRHYTKAIIDILDFAKKRGSSYVFVGGSFVTREKMPSDFDAVIVFSKKEAIPCKGERLLIEGKRADIMFCSEDEPNIVDSFLHLFSTGRYGQHSGVVQINLCSKNACWEIRHMPDDNEMEIIKRAYFNREFFDLNEPEGVLVTIHGLLTNAAWNSYIIPIASSQGWVVAPFNYGYQTPDILILKEKRKQILEQFRDWIFDVQQKYCTRTPLSLIAHSFGTYIIGAYLKGFDMAPVNFESIILTGSVLHEDFDWEIFAGKGVGRVRNEIAPNDQWIKWMPNKKWIGLDPIFGQSGIKGFSKDSSILTQHENIIFDHCNVIKPDVITQMWMPYLKANKGIMMHDFLKKC